MKNLKCKDCGSTDFKSRTQQRFGKRKIVDMFCKNCGSRNFEENIYR